MSQVEKYSLTYVLTTRNKLPYLKEVMKRLIENLQDDEEIVVIDGASTDGSAEYLRNLFKKGFIHQLLSEPDLCQAHGANKGLLLARGQIIKILTDDDAFYFPGIKKCKEFLLNHPEIDVLNANTADFYMNDPKCFYLRDFLQKHYLEWRRNERSAFWFGDQSLFFRRNKLPLIGLFHTGVACIDVEQTVRITSLRQVKIAWYTGIVSCAIYNPNSLSFAEGHSAKNAFDVKRIFSFYLSEESKINKNLQTFNLWKKIKKLIRFKKRFRNLLGAIVIFFSKKSASSGVGEINTQQSIILSDNLSIQEIYNLCDAWLEKNNSPSENIRFLHPDLIHD